MEAAMTIEQFSGILGLAEDASPLLGVLRKLTAIEKPEDVLAMAERPVGPMATWVGWNL